MRKSFLQISFGLGVLIFYVLLGSLLMKVLPGVDGVLFWHASGVVIGFLFNQYMGVDGGPLEINTPKFVEILLWFIVVFITCFVGQCLAYSILYNVGDNAFNTYQKFTNIDPVMYLMISLLFAPMSEELIFRGILYKSFRNNLGHPIISAIVVSLIFALAHGTMVHLFVGFSLSLLSIIILEITGNILNSFYTHVLYNFLAVILPSVASVFPFMRSLVFMSFLALSVLTGLILALWRVYKTKGV